MALASGTQWQFQSSATASMVNGGGFNTGNANFPTDATTDSNTANTDSPVLSSATYNFVAGDVGAWVYIKSGTNWTSGFYQIASVASNKATLSAAIGAAVQLDSTTGLWKANTVAGCATVGTPTSGTYGVDYSQQNAANFTKTDFTAVGSSTTMTSATGAFSPVSVGNIYHQTTTGTGGFGVVGWYEIVSYNSATSVVLDRTPNNGTTSVACTGYVGGALSLNASTEDSFFEAIPASSIVWFKNGTYTVNSGWSVASTNSTATNPSYIRGFNSLRGDNPTGSTRPTIANGANAITYGQAQNLEYLIHTSTAANGTITGASSRAYRCKFVNSSTTASRIAASVAGADSKLVSCECVSQNGVAAAVTNSGRTHLFGNYFHDSQTGVNQTLIGITMVGNIFESCDTAGLTMSHASGAQVIVNNTFYGREAKIGIGINLTAANSPNHFLANNILYGLTTGVSVNTGASGSNFGQYNAFYNNTTNATNFTINDTAITTLDPTFAGASQITGTTATTSGYVLTQSGGDFSTVTDNTDYLHVLSGTGVTTGIYLITAHTGTTLTTNNALGSSSAGDVTYYITTGHNFAIGTNLKALGFPGTFYGSETTGYMDPGAAQRQEAGGGTNVFIHTE